MRRIIGDPQRGHASSLERIPADPADMCGTVVDSKSARMPDQLDHEPIQDRGRWRAPTANGR